MVLDSNIKKMGWEPLDSYLLMSYGTDSVLKLSIRDGYEFYLEARNKAELDRLHTVWTAIHFNGFGSSKFVPFEEFRQSIMVEDTTHGVKINESTNEDSGISTLTGTDLTQR